MVTTRQPSIVLTAAVSRNDDSIKVAQVDQVGEQAPQCRGAIGTVGVRASCTVEVRIGQMKNLHLVNLTRSPPGDHPSSEANVA